MSAPPTPALDPATPPPPMRGPDPRALQVAGWVQARVPTGDVYLFGSRARGDWGDGSDIDLMVLAPERLSYAATRALRYDAALDALVARLFGAGVSVQVMSLGRAEFDWARTSPHHLAGGVQRDGLDPGGQPLPLVQQNNPWPAVQQHLQAAHESLRIALRNAGIGVDSVVAVEAHNALENSLKAYAVAGGAGYECSHKLDALTDRIQIWEREAPPAARDKLDALADRLPPRERQLSLPAAGWLQDLSDFREQTSYRAGLPLPGDAREILTAVQDLCRQLAARALLLCDKTPTQARYKRHPGAPWDLTQPLGGMEQATPEDFLRADVRAKTNMLRMAAVHYTAAEVAAFARYLDLTPMAKWPDTLDLMGGKLARLPSADPDTADDSDPVATPGTPPNPDNGGGTG